MASFLVVAPKNTKNASITSHKDYTNFYLNGEIISEEKFKEYQDGWQNFSDEPLVWE